MNILIKKCGDTDQLYDFTSKWGVYHSSIGFFLLPYIFSKAVALKLMTFSDIYLELLGFHDLRQTKKNRLLENIKEFEENKLGF